MPPRRVLLVKLSSLGDIVHALPLAEALRAGLGPEAHLAWAVRGAFAALLETNPHLDRIHTLDSPGVGAAVKFGRKLREERFDVALDGQGLFVSGLVTAASGAPRRIGFDAGREGNRLFLTEPTVPGRVRRPMTDRLLGFCDALGIPRLQPRRQDYLADGQADAARALLGPERLQIGCIVGASTPDKTWPETRWADLVRQLADAGIQAVLLGGAAEAPTAERIVAMAGDATPLDLTGKTPLPVLASALARCAAVVGGDSGPTHLAVAVGTPVVGLYGVTDPARTGPDWGPAASRVVDFACDDAPPESRRPRHSSLPDAIGRIPADAVREAALALLAETRAVQ